MKSDGMRILGWVIPIFCMAIACWVVIKQNVAFQAASAAEDQSQRDVEQVQKDYNDTKNLPPVIRFAAADEVPDEQGVFLDYLRKRALANDVKILNVSS